MTERPSIFRTLATPRLFVFSVVVGIAALESILWQLAGREGELSFVIVFAVVSGILATAFVWLTSRWIGRHAAQTMALTVALLPYSLHLYGKLASPTDGFGLIVVSIALAAGVALSLSSKFTLLRAALNGGVVAACLLLAMTNASSPDRPPLAGRGDYPDVMLIVLDTTRRDHLSLYGYDKPTTPALERFANRARVYEDAWSPAPWTPSSHASMFTGLLPAEHGVDGVQLPSFPSDLESLPAIFEVAGFHTAGFIANPNLLGKGWNRSFDRYEPAWYQGPHSLLPSLNWLLMGGVPIWLDNTSSDRVLKSAQRWWTHNGDAPRFLFLNLIDPHDPYHPPEAERAQFLPDMTRAESLAIEQDPQHYARKRGVDELERRVVTGLYDAEIAAMDRRLGTFFEWLAGRGELDDTLIVVTADHGERLGEQGMLGHLLVMDQHLLRVPLVLRYPSKLEPERIKDRVQLNGIPGEILALLELEGSQMLAERSLSAQVDRARRGASSSIYAVAQHRYFGWYVSQLRATEPAFDDSAYQGNWTLVANDEHILLWSPDRPDAPGRMFSLDGDPDWQFDVWNAESATRERLLAHAKELPAFEDDQGDTLRAAREIEIDKTLRERLRALGYAE